MSDTSTAQVIAFPVSRIEQVGRDRLIRSMLRLQEAAAEQIAAVAAWRDQIARLRNGVDTLGHSFEAYNVRLAEAHRGVAVLNAEARRLATGTDRAPPR